VIDAQEALRIGLVNEVVPRGQSLARALELAQFIAGLPQEAIRTDKESVARGCGRPLGEAFQIEAECFNRLIGSPDMQEGLRKFAERDHPDRKPGEPPVTPGLVRD
jgi:enoyl-CoA hydratase